MAQFEEVLDRVRLALTWASPAEIQALLEGLVKERIISEAYSKSLSLHRLTKGLAAEPDHSETAYKPASDLMNYPGSTNQRHLNQGQLSQVCRDCAITNPNQTRLDVSPMEEYSSMRCRPKMVMDEHNLNHRLFSTPIYVHVHVHVQVHDCHCRLRLDNNMTELLRSTESMQKADNDYESMKEGNSEDEKEWLEQVEEAARRIAVPLWQHWDRGLRMLLPLVPSMTTGCATSENTVTGSEAQCPVLNMEEETELAIACRSLDLYADNFNCIEAAIADPSFKLEIEGVSDTPKGLDFSTYDSAATTALDADHFSVSGAARYTSQVKACAADTNDVTDMLESDLNVCWVADRSRDTTEDLLYMTLSVLDSVENVCKADGLTDEERVDSHWGKFALNHHVFSVLLHLCIFVCSHLHDPSGVLTKP